MRGGKLDPHFETRRLMLAQQQAGAGGMLPSYLGGSGGLGGNMMMQGYGSGAGGPGAFGMGHGLMGGYSDMMDSETMRKFQQQQQQQRASAESSQMLESKERQRLLSEQVRKNRELDLIQAEVESMREANTERRLDLMKERTRLKQEQQTLFRIELLLRQQQEELERKHQLLEDLENRHRILRQDQMDRERQLYAAGMMGSSMGMGRINSGSMEPRMSSSQFDQMRLQKLAEEDRKRKMFGMSDEEFARMKRLHSGQDIKYEGKVPEIAATDELNRALIDQRFPSASSVRRDGSSSPNSSNSRRNDKTPPAVSAQVADMLAAKKEATLVEKFEKPIDPELAAMEKSLEEEVTRSASQLNARNSLPIDQADMEFRLLAMESEKLKRPVQLSSSEDSAGSTVAMEQGNKATNKMPLTLTNKSPSEDEDDDEDDAEDEEEAKSRKSTSTTKEGPKSSFRGVSWDDKKKLWVAKLWQNGKVEILGEFPSDEQAAIAVDDARSSMQTSSPIVDGNLLNFNDEQRDHLRKKYSSIANCLPHMATSTAGA